MAQSTLDSPDAALADYQAKLAQYEQIHGAFEREHTTYWDSVAAKRRIRNAKRRNHEADRAHRLHIDAAAGLFRPAAGR